MKFNKTNTTRTVNKAGGSAYKFSPKVELVNRVLSSLVEDKAYTNAEDQIEELKRLLDGVNDAVFVAQLALYARWEYGLRSISHVLAAELVAHVKGEEWVKIFIRNVCRRPDDILEIFSYYAHTYGKPIPNSLKKGANWYLEGLDEYSLSKYKGEGKAFSMVDIVNLSHPRHTEALNKLMKGELKFTKGWENKIAATGTLEVGKVEKAREKAWGDLFKGGNLPYFAMLRNLRNIIKDNPKLIPEICTALTNEEAIKKSLIFPYRFFTAYKEILQLDTSTPQQEVLKALLKAFDISLSNVPKLKGSTLVVVDESGSMGTFMSDHSETTLHEVAALFGLTLAKSNNADYMTFAEIARMRSIDPGMSVISSVINSRADGGGTSFLSIFQYLVDNRKTYDRIFIFSDMQGWEGYGNDDVNSIFNEYCRALETDPYLYSVDLAGEGTSKFPQNKVVLINGFSDKIFDICEVAETDPNYIIRQIEEIDILDLIYRKPIGVKNNEK